MKRHRYAAVKLEPHQMSVAATRIEIIGLRVGRPPTSMDLLEQHRHELHFHALSSKLDEAGFGGRLSVRNHPSRPLERPCKTLSEPTCTSRYDDRGEGVTRAQRGAGEGLDALGTVSSKKQRLVPVVQVP